MDNNQKTDDPFTILQSDGKLRKDLAKLTFENPSDGTAVEIILAQRSFTGLQRIWMKDLVNRKGKAFVFNPKKEAKAKVTPQIQAEDYSKTRG